MATIEDLRKQWEFQDFQQESVNRLFGLMGADFTEDAIRKLAHAVLGHYPQYVDYWAGPEWRLVRVLRKWEGKGGVRFEAGDIAIFKDRDYDCPGLTGYGTAFSVRGRIDCAMWPGDVEDI